MRRAGRGRYEDLSRLAGGWHPRLTHAPEYLLMAPQALVCGTPANSLATVFARSQGRNVISWLPLRSQEGGGGISKLHLDLCLFGRPSHECLNCLCPLPANINLPSTLPRTSSTTPHRTCRRRHQRAYTRTIWLRLRILRDGHGRIDHRVGLR
jgi:hypothetical protein